MKCVTAKQSPNDVTSLHMWNWRQESFDDDVGGGSNSNGNEFIGNKSERKKKWKEKMNIQQTVVANSKWKHSFRIYIYMSCCIRNCMHGYIYSGNGIERQWCMCSCSCVLQQNRLPPFAILNSDSFTVMAMPMPLSRVPATTENSLVSNPKLNSKRQRVSFAFSLTLYGCCFFFIFFISLSFCLFFWSVFHLFCYLVVIRSPATPTDIRYKIVVALYI